MAPEISEKTWDFDRLAAGYDRSVAAGDCQYYARYGEVLDAVVARVGVAAGQRILDIGTGTGALAFKCLAKSAYVVGLDPSEQMLAVAREKAGCNYRVRLVQDPDPFVHILYPDASFDAIVSSYAFHHIPHRIQPDCVREMVRVLKPGGRWAMGDVAFSDEAAGREALATLPWLEKEYFPRIDALRAAFAQLGMDMLSEQMTPVTWLMWATKPD